MNCSFFRQVSVEQVSGYLSGMPEPWLVLHGGHIPHMTGVSGFL
jgi:hypothetical protein